MHSRTLMSHGPFQSPMELDPLYFDVIVQRWENLTGKKAKRK